MSYLSQQRGYDTYAVSLRYKRLILFSSITRVFRVESSGFLNHPSRQMVDGQLFATFSSSSLGFRV